MTPALQNTAQECAQGARRYARKSLVGLIGMGLYFLKAHQLFGRSTGRPKAQAKNCATVAQLSEDAAPEGFDQWLSEAFEGTGFTISRRTAYNYMRAAVRVGLTPASTDADVHAIEASGALEGKTPAALYAPEKPADGPPPPPAPPEMKPEQLFLNFEAVVADFVAPESPYLKALGELDEAKLSAYEASLRVALDAVRETLEAKKTGRGGR